MNPQLSHTPNLDTLAANGVVFNRAYATSPWTMPSVASMFTSKMPSRHLVETIESQLSDDETTLAELLKDQGFATCGAVSHHLLQEKYGFHQGFDVYDERAAGEHKSVTSAQITDTAIEWLRGGFDSPFFLFLHYFDPHYNYMHHEAFDQTSWYQGYLTPGMNIWYLRSRRPWLTPDDIRYMIGLHREEIAFTDHHIGRLLDELDRLGLKEDTLVIFVADHGEEFMRHGWIGHTRTLYEELLQVPFIVSLPGTISPGVVNSPVSIVDIVPTITDLLDIQVDNSGWDGRTLAFEILNGKELDRAREIYAEVSFGPRNIHEPFADRAIEKVAYKTSVVSGSNKLIHDLQYDTWELFDLIDDPHELRNLAGKTNPSEHLLKERLTAWEASREEHDKRQDDGVKLNADEIRRLKSLGYLR